jgi:hypothetical protein
MVFMREKDWVLFALFAAGVAAAMGLMAIF